MAVSTLAQLIEVAVQLFLAKEEPLQAALPPRPAALLESIRSSRVSYANLLEEKSRAPDTKGDVAAQSGAREGAGSLDMINPLSLHNEVGAHRVL